MVLDTIVPAIDLLARNCPISLGDILQRRIISSSGVSGTTSCSNLTASDALFGRLKVK